MFTEPALTNCGVVFPEPGFHEGLRRVSRETGTLLMLDETHTLICGPAGLAGRWGLEPDLVVLGKGIGGGLPFGAYGMSAALMTAFERGESLAGQRGELATGGTLFGNALTMAAGRASLEEVLTDEAYDRAAGLGGLLADGLEAAVAAAGLPWKVQRLYPRSGLSLSGRLARNASEADADEQPELNALIRLGLANRGVWEAISTAGPAMSRGRDRGRRGGLPGRVRGHPRCADRLTPADPRSIHRASRSTARKACACRPRTFGRQPGEAPERARPILLEDGRGLRPAHGEEGWVRAFSSSTTTRICAACCGTPWKRTGTT